MPRDIHAQLTKYLGDAHAIEVQALAQLEHAPGAAVDPRLEDVLREHLAETRRHERTTRSLLEARGAAPSRLTDLVLNLGGKGFLAFARVMPDEPGKLLTHAYSFEALGTAAYELLARTADRAGEAEVARAARELGDDERAMTARLEQCFDGAVAASLRAVDPADLGEQVRRYLADAHAIEKKGIELLERSPSLARDSRLNALYDEHLAETREQAELVKERLDALGGDRSSIKEAALRLGALDWSAFVAVLPDAAAKLPALMFAFEHLEIGGYEQLRRVAERAGDAETAALAGRILAQERAAARRLEGAFDEAVTVALEAQGVSAPR